MPELPDVEMFRRRLNACALRQSIRALQIHDRAILKGVTALSLQAQLKGHAFKSTRRHGKNLFVEITGRKEWLRFHFGMTGLLACLKDSSPLPRHTRAVFQFSHRQLAFIDQRKLGAVGLVAAVGDYLDKKQLGPDALEISQRQFAARLGNRRGAIKAALMDQQVIAGVGNVYADELLFQARTHPAAKIENLDPSRLEAIYRAMQSVLKKAIDCRADIRRFPPAWMLPHRSRNEKCPRCGRPWKLIKVASRTTCFCPHCQRKSVS